MSTEADIVERLSKYADEVYECAEGHFNASAVMEEAADLIAKLRAERDAAARDMRERCAKVADTYKDDSRYTGDISLIGATIRALPDTPAMIATSGGSHEG